MNLEYDYDEKIFDKAVVTTDKTLKIRENTENLESILEEENLVEYIFIELDNKRAESKNEFEELQVEKISLIYKVIGLIFTILAIPVVGIYIEAIFKTLILSLLYLSGTFGMIEVIDKHPYTVELAKQAIKNVGLEPLSRPVRGGTDGARLSFMGLPCPNLCTGGHSFHGRYEYICLESMEKVVQLLIKLASTNFKNV